jgi:hypothetical protein
MYYVLTALFLVIYAYFFFNRKNPMGSCAMRVIASAGLVVLNFYETAMKVRNGNNTLLTVGLVLLWLFLAVCSAYDLGREDEQRLSRLKEQEKEIKAPKNQAE